ncbi:class 1 fructose-bisphosphatase [Methylotenera sp.]|uniref:class 1 fructose-bisphosphatase n=1 Tax=Methylotenera sp. TaxID=2051956 RepID=UPI00248A8CD2|nr:class 1 fructose-bisphosphatase [Methylotenera sp.]MDI1360473.1 class 1 fructose-bisphosphatase [Methylotenera sp.]
MTKHIKISEFLKQHLQGEHSVALNAILSDVVDVCKKIAVAIDKGAIAGNMGSLRSENVQGEVQKALDVITNDIFVEACQHSGYVAGMVSEELVDVIDVDDKHKKNGDYLLMFDPLDGSSNVNVNISVGTIFSILKSASNKPELADYLQPGTAQICAGYALYGTSTMLVFTTGNGVNGFTLDADSNEFLLTHPNMQIAKETQEFAINMSNYRFWREPVQRYIDECLQGEEGDRKKDFNMRWVASMVAEVHRILVRGGVFMYPTDTKSRSGKLRLMYEANPMSFIVEQAGGASTTGSQRILEVQPSGIHQRVPVMMGCKSEIDRIAAYHQVTSKRK